MAERLEIVITADAKNAITGFKEVERAAKQTGKRMSASGAQAATNITSATTSPISTLLSQVLFIPYPPSLQIYIFNSPSPPITASSPEAGIFFANTLTSLSNSL